ncbi:unnamed protein product (macronuclear) [Paramecium tetraurelia]|uniref:VWFA domain-containing protein n=1 Tax=Paramecium tetraurelia TaxID=5888 RepID=A0ED74_PARTE|nr:uncharacterized protein GSPATT00004110001 [Paramecium tetraurelia]CAK93241.1 unnamed protein product [Paramecium tetraurelia]|eukprot:XP_001460638.1 hypothetical protein (macronuclear) [Paramecium tetraurelia strain d4-2]
MQLNQERDAQYILVYQLFGDLYVFLNDQLKQKKLDLLEKFFAYLQKNDYKLSRIQASELFETIKRNFELQFYNKYTPQIVEEIQNQQCDLEQQFLESDDKEFIINYIIDQKNVINNHVDKKLDELTIRLEEDFQFELAEQYQELIEKLKKNAHLLKEYLVPNLNVEEYFENPQQDLERKLFGIVVCFLQGSNSRDINLINKKYKFIFYQGEKVKVEFHLNNLQNPEIKLLDVFVEELIEILNQKKNIKIQLNFNLFKMQEQLFKKKIEMQGCQTSCGFCNRKCDLQQEHQSNHECQNGHFLIVNLEKQKQQYSCDDDFFFLRRVENFEWDFDPKQNIDQKKQLKDKLIKIWQEYGQDICNKLQKSYQNIQQLNHNRVHYIFILDSSESMNKDWTDIKKGVREFIKKIKEKDQVENKEFWISLILFNKEQTTLINSKRARDIKTKFKMNFLGGGTNFGKPIKKAINLVKKDNTSDLFLILFYTDGKAAIPEQELKKMQNLEEEKRKKIHLIACTHDSNTQNKVLNNMVKYFSDHIKQAEIFTFSSANVLIGFWSVVINFRLNR